MKRSREDAGRGRTQFVHAGADGVMSTERVGKKAGDGGKEGTGGERGSRMRGRGKEGTGETAGKHSFPLQDGGDVEKEPRGRGTRANAVWAYGCRWGYVNRTRREEGGGRVSQRGAGDEENGGKTQFSPTGRGRR